MKGERDMAREPIPAHEEAKSLGPPAELGHERHENGAENSHAEERDERRTKMLNRMASKAVRIARGTTLALGLAVMLSLMLALAAGAAEAEKAKSLKAGVQNAVSAVTSTVGSGAGPVLRLDNNSTASDATALDLQVEAGQAPLTVSEGAGKATNLDADKLDGKDSTEFLGTTIKVRYGSLVRVPKSGPVVRASFAYCQTGEKFLSGGHTVTDDPSDPPAANQSGVYDTFAIEGSPVTQTGSKVPTDGGTPIGWHAGVKNNSAQVANKDVLLRTYAVCAS
jgi:hypothetical protein